MAIIKTIPPSSKFVQVDQIFLATFNNPTLNKYDFNIPANINRVLLDPMTPTSIYIIDRISFSAQIAEGTYLEAIDVTPTAQLTLRINGMQIYYKPIPCINYIDNAECQCYFWSKVSAKDLTMQDALCVTFRGILNQVAAMAGLLTIRCLLSLSLYEIVDRNFTQRVREATTDTPQTMQVF